MGYNETMVTITVQDSIAAPLSAQAHSQGLSLEEYLAVLARAKTGEAAEQSLPRLSNAELDRLLDAESSEGPAYPGTYSRADIYRDHD